MINTKQALAIDLQNLYQLKLFLFKGNKEEPKRKHMCSFWSVTVR